MSRIEQLIEELCPEGVEWKTIDDVCNISRGRVMSKDYIRDNSGVYPVYSSQTANDGILGKINTFDYDGEYLTWTTDGAYAGSVFYRKGRFSITNVCGLLEVNNAVLYPKFLLYCLNIVAKRYVSEGMGNPKLMSNAMAKIPIPLPPLPIQQEIVTILDKFTALDASLQAELEARRKQYEHYRNQLLNFEGKSIQRLKLVEIAQVINGRAYSQPELLSEGKYPVLRVGNFFTNNSWYYSNLELEENKYCDNGDLLYAWSASFGPKLWNGNKVIYHYHIWKIDCRKIIDKKFLYYWLQSEDMVIQAFSIKHGATMAHLTKEKMEKLMVPVPPLSEQERIVGMLDKFDALVSSTGSATGGLPAEIDARRKQYEYYREKLLTFEPK